MRTALIDHANIDEVGDTLRNLPRDTSLGTIESNRSFMSRLGRPENVVPLLTDVLGNPERLSYVASRSYRHVNHFDKIVLVGNDDPQAYRLTLHLWQPPYSEKELSDELIHEHRFNFWSVILTGVLCSETYEPSESGKTFRQYRYVPEARSRTFRDFYEFRGETRLEEKQLARKVAGESYYLSAPTIHRIVLPRHRVTCSLVLRGPRLREYSNVFNSTYPVYDTQFGNAMFSEQAVADKLRALVDSIYREPGLAPAGPLPALVQS